MKKQQLLLVAAAVAVVIVAAIFLLRRPPASAPAPPPQQQQAPEILQGGTTTTGVVAAGPTPAPAPPPVAVAPAPTPAPSPLTIPQRAEPPPQPAPSSGLQTVTSQMGGNTFTFVRARPDEVLAAVNGVPITVKDLSAVPAAQANLTQTILAEAYGPLRDQAVERELILQAVKAQGVELTAQQQQQLAEMRASMEKPSPDGVQQPKSPEEIEFDLRDATARMLKGDLAARAGVSSSDEEALRKYVEQLKANANITITEPQPQ